MVQDEPRTIILWLWNGWRPVYDVRHVNATAGMLFDNLTIPVKLVCITDQPPNRMRGCEVEVIPLWDLPFQVSGIAGKQPNSYVRLKMFSPWAAEAFPGLIWSIDLDSVIMENIDSIPTNDDFKINRGRSAPYNGGMWQLRTGTRTKVWTEFNPKALEITKKIGYIGSDQAWISHILPKEKMWDTSDGVFHFSVCRKFRVMPPKCKMMFFAGRTKPWSEETRRIFPLISRQYYRYF